MATTLRPMTTSDAEAVLRIYQDGIDTGHATFQPVAPPWADWNRGHLPHSRLVAETDGAIAGWAAVLPTSTRPVYRGVGEHSIYIATAARGRGIGRLLLDGLVAASEAAGMWTLQSGIFPENRTSLALHRTCGFRELGVRRQVGRMAHGPLAGQWRDVVLVERRSTSVGID